ncbi:MAG: PRC-barrel domain-containing protein [Desulfuromonadales bacterium]
MRKQFTRTLTVLLASGALCASGALAAQNGQTGQEQDRYGATSGQMQQQQTAAQQAGQQNQFQAVDSFDDMKIQNQQGQQLGEVDEILVDMNQGRLAFVVLSGGGALGVGEDKYIVPWQMISMGTQQEGLVVNVESLDQLRPVPQGEEIEQALDRQSGREIFQFYGISPYWEEGGRQQQQMQEQMQPGQPGTR